MCYPNPGPRCSSYAAKVLIQAKIRARNERSLEASAAQDAAQLEYDATPAGMKELERRIKQGKGRKSQYELEYELRLQLGQAKRAERLSLIKVKDRGDIKHKKQAVEETMFPDNFHRFAENYDNEPEIRMDSAEITKLIEDSSRFTDKLNHDEMEALSWYTSNGSSIINKHLTGNSEPFYLNDYIDDETNDEFDAREAAAGKAHIEHLNTTAEHLDTALEKSKRETFLKVYRGVSSDVMKAEGFKRGTTAEYIETKFPVGGTFKSPVFMSSSLEYKRGKGFETSGVVMEVLGKTVAPVANVSAWGATEKEYVLPRNIAYTVKAVKTIKNEFDEELYVIQLEED